jgi:hypothetical protein
MPIAGAMRSISKYLLVGVLCLLSRAASAQTPAEASPSPTGALGGLPTGVVLKVACNLGTEALLYSPGLIPTPRPVQLNDTALFGGCVSVEKPSLNSGISQFSASDVVQGCLLPGQAVSVTKTLRWNTGETSVFTASTVANPGPNGTQIVVATGVVTHGLFQGSQIVQVLTLANTNLLACLLSPQGVEAVSGPATLEIFSLEVSPH